MKRSQLTQTTALCATIGAALVFSLVGLVSAAKPAPTALTFTIDDTTAPSNAVFSDGNGYKDYRLTGGDFCVEGSPDSALVLLRLNRKLDGEAGTMYCGLNGGTPRQWSMTVTGDACAELFSTGYSDTSDPAGCTLTGHDKPRIRLANLYANRATSTPVAFMTEDYSAGPSYEVRTDTDAGIIVSGGDTGFRTVQYNGTARLWKFGIGKAAPVASAFPLPFQMTFHRSAIP